LLKNLRGDPRYIAFLKKLRLPLWSHSLCHRRTERSACEKAYKFAKSSSKALELNPGFAQTHVRLSLIFEQADDVIAPPKRVT